MNAPVTPTAGLPVVATGNTPARIPTTETPHQRFIRLADARAKKVLEGMRLLGQLIGRTYEHTPREAEILVKVLSQGVHETAKNFSVPYAAKIGRAGLVGEQTVFDDPTVKSPAETNKMKLAIARALDKIRENEIAEAQEILTDLL